MHEHAATAPPKLFRSYLLYPAVVLFSLGAILGLAAVVFLFVPGSVSALISDLLDRGIMDMSAIGTWTVLNIAMMIIGAACAVVMAVAIWLERWRKGDGLDLLYNFLGVMTAIVKVSGGIALAVLILRLSIYLVSCDWANAGIYEAYGLLLAEGIMIAQAVGLFFLLLRFLDRAWDSAASMAYTRTCDKLDDRPIPSFCATGMFLLALISGYLAWDWLATMRMGKELTIALAAHPMQLLAGGMFACLALGNILIWRYLKRYMRISEQHMFRSLQETAPGQ